MLVCLQPNGMPNAYETHGLVTIRMKPDPQGRFGFNVKVSAVTSRSRSTPVELYVVVYATRTYSG